MRKLKFLLLLLVVGGLLMIMAAVLFLKQNNLNRPFQPTPFPPSQTLAGSPTPPPPVSAGPDQATYPEIPRVSLEQAKTAFDAGSALFIDVRGENAYAVAHIPGALNIQLADLESRLTDLDPSRWIITYCT